MSTFCQQIVSCTSSLGRQSSDEGTNWTPLYETAFTTTSLVLPYLACALLGWQPKEAGLIYGLPTYYAAYLALLGQVAN